MPRGWRTRLQVARDQVARDPGLLACVGAVLLMCAPVLPGLSRLVVLPALLLAPGYALLRLLGQATGTRSISVAVPVSLVLAICASLVLDVSGIRLGPLSLGLLLGAVTALFLAGSYCRQLVAGPRGKLREHRPTTRRYASHPDTVSNSTMTVIPLRCTHSRNSRSQGWSLLGFLSAVTGDTDSAKDKPGVSPGEERLWDGTIVAVGAESEVSADR